MRRQGGRRWGRLPEVHSPPCLRYPIRCGRSCIVFQPIFDALAFCCSFWNIWNVLLLHLSIHTSPRFTRTQLKCFLQFFIDHSFPLNFHVISQTDWTWSVPCKRDQTSVCLFPQQPEQHIPGP